MARAVATSPPDMSRSGGHARARLQRVVGRACRTPAASTLAEAARSMTAPTGPKRFSRAMRGSIATNGAPSLRVVADEQLDALRRVGQALVGVWRGGKGIKSHDRAERQTADQSEWHRGCHSRGLGVQQFACRGCVRRRAASQPSSRRDRRAARAARSARWRAGTARSSARTASARAPESAPADCPKTVTRSGSPPKAPMLSCTHCSA